MMRRGMTVTVRGYRGIAFRVKRVRQGRALVYMVGDDREFNVDVEDCTNLPRKDYCGVCGQVGCTCDGLER